MLDKIPYNLNTKFLTQNFIFKTEDYAPVGKL